MAAPATNNHSPRSSGYAASAALNSPRSRRGTAARGVTSPWTQIVRGAESDYTETSSGAGGSSPPPSSPSFSSAAVQEQIASSSSDWPPSRAVDTVPSDDSTTATEDQMENSDNGSLGGNAANKKPVWNKPSNGAAEVGPVMGALSWPALSESTRASPKSSSSDSLKALSDGSSLPAAQGTGTGTVSSSPNKQVIANNANPNPTPNHGTPSRQRSFKRGGGNSSGGVSANGGFPQPPPPLSPQGSVVEMSPVNPGKPGSTAVESSSRDHSYKEPGQKGGFGSQSHSGNDHQQHRPYRRGNGGPHPRGDGSYHHRNNQDWNPHRRDNHMQPQRGVPRGFIRPLPHNTAPFMPPPSVPMRPYVNPMIYPDVASPLIYVPGPHPDSLRGVPLVAPIPAHPMFFHVPDLHTKIVNQIDYYFSNENLVRDTFLRQNMDAQGWVPIKLIAGFKKVLDLTDNIQLILDAVRGSTVVETQGDKVRKRNEWMRWIMPAVPYSPVSSPQSMGRSSHDMLAAHLQSATLDENARQGHAEMFFSRSSSVEFDGQPQQSAGEGISQATLHAGFDAFAGN